MLKNMFVKNRNVQRPMREIKKEVIEDDAEKNREQLKVDRLGPFDDVVLSAHRFPAREKEKKSKSERTRNEDRAENHAQRFLDELARDGHSRLHRDSVLPKKLKDVQRGEKSVDKNVGDKMNDSRADDEDEDVVEVVVESCLSFFQEGGEDFFMDPLQRRVLMEEVEDGRSEARVANELEEERSNEFVANEVMEHQNPKRLEDESDEIRNNGGKRRTSAFHKILPIDSRSSFLHFLFLFFV